MSFAVWMLYSHEQNVATYATVMGAILSVVYFLQKQNLEELRIFREIFKECNARYDELNEDLAAIIASQNGELSSEEKVKVIDYFNLCGEEYLYFKRGYIDPSVWNAWHQGMKVIVASPRIEKLWALEKSTCSYYDLPL